MSKFQELDAIKEALQSVGEKKCFLLIKKKKNYVNLHYIPFELLSVQCKTFIDFIIDIISINKINGVS